LRKNQKEGGSTSVIGEGLKWQEEPSTFRGNTSQGSLGIGKRKKFLSPTVFDAGRETLGESALRGSSPPPGRKNALIEKAKRSL